MSELYCFGLDDQMNAGLHSNDETIWFLEQAEINGTDRGHQRTLIAQPIFESLKSHTVMPRVR